MFRPGPPRDLHALSERFRIGEVEVDLGAARAYREGTPIELEPKAFDLLLLLAANAGRLVEKDEIFARLWPGVTVGDNALTRVVAQLRRGLGDDADAPRYLETLRTRGYRFLVQPTVAERSPPDAATTAPRSEALSPPRAFRGRRRAGLAVAGLAVAGVVAYAGWREWRRSAGPSEWFPEPAQVTREHGYHGDADYSPDGSQIVYSSDAAGGLELFIRPSGGGPARQLTRGGGPKIDAAWSPNGDAIVYRDVADGGLWSIPPTGGAPRKLVDLGSQPAFFPNGQRLVYSSPGTPTIGYRGWPATYSSTLSILDLRTGETRQLTRVDAEAGGHGMPAVSADGRWVYFATGRFDGGALWRIPANGGKAERLTPPGEEAFHYWYDPTPTPDGASLLAVAAGRSEQIVRIPLEGRGRPYPVYAGAPNGIGQLALSRDGRRLLYSITVGRTSLEEAEIDPATLAVAAVRVVASPATLRLSRPSYSPDGGRLAYLQLASGVAWEAVVRERATGEERSYGEDVTSPPLWIGPERLLFGVGGSPVALDVVSGQRRPERPPAGLASLRARASPRPTALRFDRRSFAFTAPGDTGAIELFLGDPESGEATQVTRFGRRVDYPAFSSDGRWLGFQVVRGDDASANELWRLRTAGGAPERLATADGPSWAAAFSPDGERVAYAAHREGSWCLAVAGVDAPERRLAIEGETAGYVRWPSWSPDGRHLAYERMHYEASLWMLELPSP